MSEPQPPPEGAPPELLEWIDRFGDGVHEGAGVSGLATAARQALSAALSRPVRDREGAFALLAADALMTMAVERVVAGEDPPASLRELVDSVTRESSGGAA